MPVLFGGGTHVDRQEFQEMIELHLPWTSCGEHAKGRESMRERWKRLNPIEEYDEREQWDKQWEERKQYEGKDQ